jgi:hypothetical protein
MTTWQLEEFISETKIFLRDFKINTVLDSKNQLKVVKPSGGPFYFLYKAWGELDYLSKLDGIITGSFALTLYRFNGHSILERKPDDWDILIDRQNFLKYCGSKNINNFYYDKDRMSVNVKSGVYVGSYGYETSTPHYILKHDIDILAKDTLPDFIQVGKYKIATLESILSEKLNLIESCMKSGYTISIENKHILDCNSIVSKIQAYAK